jgi:imidazolonepropionase-like amidohydrolase
LLAPRLYTAGPAAGPAVAGAVEAGFTTFAGALNRLRFYQENGTDYAKDRMIGTPGDLPDVPRLVRRHYVAAARALRLSVTAHNADFGATITNVIDGYGGHEHLFSVGAIYDDVAQLVASADFTFTPTLALWGPPPGSEVWRADLDPRMHRFIPAANATRIAQWHSSTSDRGTLLSQQASRIANTGGRVAVGTDVEAGAPAVHWEMWAMSAGGMTPMQVLHAATIAGAEALGYDKDFGSLQAGRLADLQILDKNPLDDIHNTITTRFVMKNGRLYDARTLEELYPDKRAAPIAWWQRSDDPTAQQPAH